ncbi:hypothetical protein KTE13_27935 [Burkholderia multivorans]|uniref:hypothetical protein n=1 Tax=Burkholderia multivorans TaxID=87883 RepID=UPI001C245787|nr:hypothetical protein [Burkholderia multivorans]MBU9403578.1 hypothetical protein [Burkholderia multivorans]
MFATDQATAVSALPTPALAGTPGFFTGGNPATGQPATILDADWLNMVQQELLNILAAAGISPSKTTYNQVLTALEQLFAGTGETGNFAGFVALNASAILAGSEAGSVIQYYGSGGATFTLPATGSMGQTARVFPFSNNGSGPVTVAAAAGEHIDDGNILVTSIVLNPGDTLIIASQLGTQTWIPIAGSAAIPFSSTFRALTNGRSAWARYNGTPTSGTATTFSKSLATFTAPCNGFVMATQSVNIGGASSPPQPGSQQSTVQIVGSVSGTAQGGDSSVFPMNNFCVLAVQTGESVTVSGSLVSNGASGTWNLDSLTIGYIFVPSGN